MGFLDIYSESAQSGAYRGNNEAVRRALSMIVPIDLNVGKQFNEFSVIDGFLAVIDGRRDPLGAAMLSRELIQRPEFPAVNIVHDYSARVLETSEERIRDTFSKKAFGYEINIASAKAGESASEARMRRKANRRRGTPVIGRSPASGGAILPVPGKNEFYYQNGGYNAGAFYETNKISPSKLRSFTLPGIFKSNEFLGQVFQELMGTYREAYPEALSWYIKRDKITSDPGLLHADTGYHLDPRRITESLPKILQRAAQQESFDVLSGNLAKTVALSGGGTIVVKNDGRSFRPEHFAADANRRGFQARNGNPLIARTVGWPDDPITGKPRLPGYHCSPLISVHGDDDNHRGRIMTGTSCESSYPHPYLVQHLLEHS